MRKVLLLITLMWPLIVGCDVLETSQSEACVAEPYLLTDSFDGDINCGWATYSQGGATSAIEDGVLSISTGQPGQVWWSTAPEPYENVKITVEATMMEGPDDNAFGIICGFQDSENFYVFLISTDGYYVIGKYQSGSDQITYLTGDGEYQPTTAITSNTNSIEAVCNETQLSMSVNGILLETVTEPRSVVGQVGVAASTFVPGTAIVNFDNMRIVRP